MAENPVSEFIDQLKDALDVNSDQELADALGIGKSTIASWRRRGDVPKKTQSLYFALYGVDFQLIKTGRPSEEAQAKRLFEKAFLIALLRLGKSLPESEVSDYAEWLVDAQVELRTLLLKPLFGLASKGYGLREHNELVRRVLAGEVGHPEQIAALKSGEWPAS